MVRHYKLFYSPVADYNTLNRLHPVIILEERCPVPQSCQQTERVNKTTYNSRYSIGLQNF